MIDPAMIQWNPNPEMFPNQPVGLPSFYTTQSMPTARISADPINAFNAGTPQPPPMSVDPIGAFNSGLPTTTNTNPIYMAQPSVPFSRATPEPDRTFAPSYGPMQDLALQMAGYGGPSGYRAPTQMSVTPYSPSPAAGGGGYDGASNDRPDSDIPPVTGTPNPVADPGMGGGGLPNNNTWINDLGVVSPGTNIGLPGGSYAVGGGDLGSIGSAISSGISTIFNPIGSIVDAITGDDGEEGDGEDDGERTPQIGGNPLYGEFGALPGVPGTTDGYPFGSEPGLPVQTIGNVGGALDDVLRRISPYFSNLVGR